MNKDIDHEPMRTRQGMPRSIWVLGFVSMFMDISSEMIHSLLPVFIVGVLGGSVFFVGLIEGVGESIAMIVKVISGVLSDRMRHRKYFAVLGYALGTLAKPMFAIAGSVTWILVARCSDRIGKGIRGAPRDALIADLTPKEIRGAAYGLRQALDTVGAFLGPLLAIVLMLLLADNFRLVFWCAVIPGSLSVLLLVAGVREPEQLRTGTQATALLHMDTLRRFDRAYWWVVAIGAVFALARFSEAFLVLRASDLGLPVSYAPAVLITMNIVFALCAYPLGKLADRVDHRWLLAAGLVTLVLADLLFAHAHGLGLVFSGVAVWGVYLGITQGLLSTMVADVAPVALRGSAFGIFNLVSGLALLLASIIAGLLWDSYGPAVTFYAGAALALVTLVLVVTRE